VAHAPDGEDHRPYRRYDRRPPGSPPLASDIAAGLSRLRSALDECYLEPDLDRPRARKDRRPAGKDGPPDREGPKPWPVLPPLDALDAGIPFREVLRQGVRAAQQTSLAAAFHLPIRAALAARGVLSRLCQAA
jgi:hypothetical protein